MAKKKTCANCFYGKRFSGGGVIYCDYLLMTCRCRPCPAKNCTEWKERPQKQTREYKLIY